MEAETNRFLTAAPDARHDSGLTSMWCVQEEFHPFSTDRLKAQKRAEMIYDNTHHENMENFGGTYSIYMKCSSLYYFWMYKTTVDRTGRVRFLHHCNKWKHTFQCGYFMHNQLLTWVSNFPKNVQAVASVNIWVLKNVITINWQVFFSFYINSVQLPQCDASTLQLIVSLQSHESPSLIKTSIHIISII